jgi:Zn-dependent protease
MSFAIWLVISSAGTYVLATYIPAVFPLFIIILRVCLKSLLLFLLLWQLRCSIPLQADNLTCILLLPSVVMLLHTTSWIWGVCCCTHSVVQVREWFVRHLSWSMIALLLCATISRILGCVLLPLGFGECVVAHIQSCTFVTDMRTIHDWYMQ